MSEDNPSTDIHPSTGASNVLDKAFDNFDKTSPEPAPAPTPDPTPAPDAADPGASPDPAEALGTDGAGVPDAGKAQPSGQPGEGGERARGKDGKFLSAEPATPKTAPPKTAEVSKDAASPKPAPKKEEPKVDAEIEGAKIPKGLPPEAVKLIQTARGTAKSYKGKAKELETRLKETEAKLAQLPEETQKKIEALERFRAMHAMGDDPKFRERFDAKIESDTAAVYESLKLAGLDEETINEIKKAGGIFEAKDKAGNQLLDSPWWEESVKENKDIPYSKRLEIQRKIDGVLNMKADRQKELEGLAANREKFYQEEQQKQQAAFQADESYLNGYTKQLQDALPWAKRHEIPPDASEEERKKIEGDNEFYDKMEGMFIQALWPKDIKVRASVATLACLSFKQDRDLAEKEAQIEAIQAELNGIRNAGRTSAAASAAPSKRGAETSKAQVALASRRGAGDVFEAAADAFDAAHR